jgi:DNA-directed RNA polymerase beta' subunit/intein/homing endonuclease
MNLHKPQSIEAETEIMVNSRCAVHIVSPQRNGPVNGIVQDGCVSSHILTMTWKNGSFTMVDIKTAYSIYKSAEIPDTRITDLIYRAKDVYSEYIVKNDNEYNFTESIPGALFLSVIFPPNFRYTKKFRAEEIIVPSKPSVEIKDGIILPISAPLCGKTVGGKNNSIVHYMWKKSPEMALFFISDLQQLTDYWMPTHGFTIGIRDCFTSNEKEIAKALIETRMKVAEIIANAKEHDKHNTIMEMEINTELNNAMAIGPLLAKNSMAKGELNGFDIMRNSGAKGSVINITQIAAFVGQQNIKGKRMPKQLTHNTRCLPSFLPGDNSPDARGFIENNYVRGLTPQESFFHAAAGRDGIIATSLKTSETGYMQKRIARKTEDSIVCIDGSIRDANMRIISFMYGDDGMDSKKIMSVEGLNCPFFVDPVNLAHQLNSDAKRAGEEEELYKLTNDDIEQLLLFINFSKIKSPIIENVNRNVHNNLKIIMKRVEIYKSKMIDLFVAIRDAYNNSKAPYGLSAGLIATASIGEPTTQMVLNSVAYDTKILIIAKTKSIKVVKIGKLIDSMMKNNIELVQNINQNGKTSEYLELDEPFYIPTTDDFGNTSWGKVTALTRHPPHGDVVKITTRSGRNVIVTKSKSLLIWNEQQKKFVQTCGNIARIGDYVPIMQNIPDYTTIINVAHLRKYLPPTEWVYGTDLLNAYDAWSALNGRAPRKWWEINNGDIFTLPYTRGDSAMRAARNNNVEYGMVYPLNSANVVSKIPEKLPLDEETGYFMGIYLADGWATETFVGIAKNEPAILERVKKWCKLYSINHHTTVTESEQFENAKTTVLTLHSALLARLLKQWVGTGSSNKVVPREAFISNLNFVKGLLDGYISGDGTVGKKKLNIIVSSASKELIEGISMLCTRFGIFGVMSMVQPKSNNVGSLNIKPSYTFRISNCWATKFAEQIGSTHPKKKKRMEQIEYTGKGYAFSKTSNDCVLDPIVAIEEIPEDNHPKVYDLTVPSTLNFCVYNGMGLADTFQSCGIKGKDASSGVPKFKQLINITKTKDQKNTGCTIYFTHPLIHENAEIISKNSHSKEAIDAKKSSFAFIESLKTTFEETYVKNFIIDYDLLYISLQVDPKTDASSVSLLKYKEYIEPWWTFKQAKPQYWVIRLKFDIEKLYLHRIELDDIAFAINKHKNLTCVVSPNIIGIIDVHVNLKVLKKYFLSKLKTHSDSYLTDSNINFYICRDVIIDLIYKTQISGVEGIFKVYSRELLDTHEFVMDTDGSINFLKILTMPNVDGTRTICDDLHLIYSTFGIEAARRFLFLELQRVISFDGTYINARHISVLVDNITSSGTLTAASRDGISRENAGPNAKIMFEKNIDNAVVASAFAETDYMKSLASSVMFGKLANVGSGLVLLRNKEKTAVKPVNISNPKEFVKVKNKKYHVSGYTTGLSKPFQKVT